MQSEDNIYQNLEIPVVLLQKNAIFKKSYLSTASVFFKYLYVFEHISMSSFKLGLIKIRHVPHFRFRTKLVTSFPAKNRNIDKNKINKIVLLANTLYM